MIAVEIRNDELRAVLFKGGALRAQRIEKTSTVKVEQSEILGLTDGKILPLVDKMEALLYKLDIGDITKEKYVVTINLEGIMTQRVTIPKVKDSQISFSAKSALSRTDALLGEGNLVSFALQKEEHVEEKSRGYNVLTLSIDRLVAASIIGIFEHMELTVKYVDVSPNTLIKIFNKSSYVETENPLTIIIELSKDGTKYYRFLDNNFHSTYLLSTKSDEAGYLDEIDNQIYNFIDEFTDYSISQMDILLMGEPDIIEEVLLNYEGIVEVQMSKLSEGIDIFKNPKDLDMSKYLNSVGSMVRNDLLLSSQQKYDVNLINDLQTASRVVNSGEVIKKIAIVGTVGVLLGGSYLTLVSYTNNKLEKDNKEIMAFLDDPDTQSQIIRKETLQTELDVYDSGLDKLLEIEDYLVTTKKPYGSRAYYSIVQGVPRDGNVKSIDYEGDGLLKLAYETTNENTFKEFLSNLERNSLVEYAEYGGYSSDSGGYAATIEVKLKGNGE